MLNDYIFHYSTPTQHSTPYASTATASRMFSSSRMDYRVVLLIHVGAGEEYSNRFGRSTPVPRNTTVPNTWIKKMERSAFVQTVCVLSRWRCQVWNGLEQHTHANAHSVYVFDFKKKIVLPQTYAFNKVHQTNGI